MTALTTLPFLTVPSGDASLTAAVTTSPRPAFLPSPPPSGRITCSLRAPELSATSRMVLICTDIFVLLGQPARGYCPLKLSLNLDQPYFASASGFFSSSCESEERRTISSNDQRLSFDSGL